MSDPFQTTRWSRVLAAGGDDEEARDALGWLCETYWLPVYAFARRRGLDAEDARDLTQSYFATLLEKRVLEDVDPHRGRFRAFLLASLKNFLSKERDRRGAQKRGGSQAPLALDDAEERYGAARSADASPEQQFEQRWALLVLERAIARLADEFRQANRADRFEVLRGCLTGDADGNHGERARRLDMTEGAFGVLLHRTRKRLGVLLREEVAQTVVDPADIDDEVRYLLAVVSR